ncbi:MAG: NTP transferase domain-containing protein, partial [Elusimicrobia bacterium]|nr:NTP transferase domain-containing protein [Elusimicrobiota bacterium]
MQVVILCGGMGFRLREETESKPKPMVEIGGKPILWHIMMLYAHHGFKDFILCLGYRGDIIKQYFLNYRALSSNFTIAIGKTRHDNIQFHTKQIESDWKVTLVDTGLNAMTGARLKRIKPFIKGPDFMVTYGDGLANVDLRALFKFHR